MADPKVHFSRVMSAKWLHESDDVQWNCEHQLDNNTHLRILQDGVQYERIFRVKLADGDELQNIDDVEVYIEPGLEDSRAISGVTATDPFAWMVASDEHAIGVQLADITQYSTQGPYWGLEGTPGRVLQFPGERRDRLEPASVQHWPRYFRITLKPFEQVGFCSSPVEDGHLTTIEYDTGNPVIRGTNGLWLEAYRFQPSGQYIINYVKVIVTSNK